MTPLDHEPTLTESLVAQHTVSSDEIRNISVIGTGSMGSIVALCFSMAGYEVSLYGRTEEKSLRDARTRIGSAIEDLRVLGLIESDAIPGIWERLHLTTDLSDAVRHAHFISESVEEVLESKQAMFERLDPLAPAEAIFATNTSSFSPTEVFKVVSKERRQRSLGGHVFSPPHLVELVEVVKARDTLDSVMDTSCELFQGIGKQTVRLEQEIDGYIVNRIQAAMWLAGYLMVEAGVPKEEVDHAAISLLADHLQNHGVLTDAHFTGEHAVIASHLHQYMQKAAQELIDLGYASVEHVNTAVALTIGLRFEETGPILSCDLTQPTVARSIMQNLGLYIPKPLDRVATAMEPEKNLPLDQKTIRGIYEGPPEFWADVSKRRAATFGRNLKNNGQKTVVANRPAHVLGVSNSAAAASGAPVVRGPAG